MDGNQFDRLTTSLVSGASRRQVIKGLAGGAAAALAGVFGAGRTGAQGPCRPAGHPCEGGQSEQCCQDVFALTCIEGSGSGAAERCCLPGSSVCGSGGSAICCPAEATCTTSGTCDCPGEREFCGFLCCPSGEVCDDEETGTCVCVPDNATACAGLECGDVVNNCGDTVSCGTCTGTGETCQSGQCICTPDNATACAGRECGDVVNNCGATVSCGTCPNGVCTGGQCVPNAVCPNNRPLLCPGQNGHKDKCCPRDTVCDNSPSGAVNCRKP